MGIKTRIPVHDIHLGIGCRLGGREVKSNGVGVCVFSIPL